MASLLAGPSRRRLVLLVDRAELMALAGEDDLIESMSALVGRIVLGVVELHHERDGEYTMRVVVHDEEYVPLLRNVGSAVAAQDGVQRLRWRGRLLSPRPWGPYIGIRRRGTSVRRRFQQMRDVSNERMNKMVELLCRMFTLSDSARYDDVVPTEISR